MESLGGLEWAETRKEELIASYHKSLNTLAIATNTKPVGILQKSQMIHQLSQQATQNVLFIRLRGETQCAFKTVRII